MAAAPLTGSPSDGLNHWTTETIAGLRRKTRYHFRIVATNATGATYGQDVSFRTKGP